MLRRHKHSQHERVELAQLERVHVVLRDDHVEMIKRMTDVEQRVAQREVYDEAFRFRPRKEGCEWAVNEWRHKDNDGAYQACEYAC